MASVDDEIKKWQGKMKAAAKQLPYSAKAEGEYMAAHKKLVQLGANTALRQKYRGY